MAVTGTHEPYSRSEVMRPDYTFVRACLKADIAARGLQQTRHLARRGRVAIAEVVSLPYTLYQRIRRVGNV